MTTDDRPRDDCGGARGDDRAPSERERAAAYLDLWERHLARTAVFGCGGGRNAAAPAD